MVDKKSLSERDICSKYITPAITGAGWDLLSQIREEVSFTKGRIIVRGKLNDPRGQVYNRTPLLPPMNFSESC